MRHITYTPLFILSLLLSQSAKSQFSLSLGSGLRAATEKVLNAYQQQFASIQGDTLSVSNNAEVFASTVSPGAETLCTLTHYVQQGESVYSWEAMMLRTDDFAAASKKYNACCMQLKGITASMGSIRCKFESDFEPTSASNKSFYSTLFRPGSSQQPCSKLRLEVLLEADIAEWTVRVIVYDNDRKDTEGTLGR